LGSKHEGTYQGLDCSLEARNCEPWFQGELAGLDRLRKIIDGATACGDELGQISIKQPPPLILEVEHSEADSTEVIPGLKHRSNAHPGFRFEREDTSFNQVKNVRIKCYNVTLRTSNAPPRHHGGAEAVKQKFFDLNQAMQRLRDERVQ
jgi:hypothetical protein